MGSLGFLRRRIGRRLPRRWPCFAGLLACVAAAPIAEWAALPARRSAWAVAFAPSGGRLATVSTLHAGKIGRLEVWDAESGRRVASAHLPDELLSVAFDPSGRELATGSWSGEVRVWDASTGALRRSFRGLTTPVRGLAYTPDGRRLIAGGSDGLILTWEEESGRVVRRIDRGKGSPVNSLAISRDGKYLAAAGGLHPHSTTVHEVESGAPVERKSLAWTYEPVRFAPGSSILAARSLTARSTVSLIDLDADRLGGGLPAGSVRTMAFSPDGRQIATAGDGSTVTIWDLASARPIATFAQHRRPPDPLDEHLVALLEPTGLASRPTVNTVWGVAFSPDGSRLASVDHDGAIWLQSVPGRGTSGAARALALPPRRARWIVPVRWALTAAALACLAAGIWPKRAVATV